MDQNNKAHARLSYSGRHPDLASGTPVSLRDAKPTRLFFNEAVDPLLKKQREALKLKESQRREAMGSGSMMVKLHKPFPDLKPTFAKSQIKKSFNAAWLREKQQAAMHYLQQQARQDEVATPTQKIQPRGYEQS